MPAPTALLRRPDQLVDSEAGPLPQEGDSDIAIDSALPKDMGMAAASTNGGQNDTQVHFDEESNPKFTPAREEQVRHVVEGRKIPVPPHRLSPLKSAWPDMLLPLVEHLKLQVRMNMKSRSVELRTSAETLEAGSLQKGEDFVRAFTLGFDVADAVALLRLDDLYIETFEIKDVKSLSGDHMGRAIGRISGKDGKTKFAIENASRTRIVLADQKIHILGGFRNIRIAREAIVSLILGSPPGKVYGNLRTVASRMKERF